MNKAVWLGMSVLTALNVLILLIMVLAGSLWFNLYMIAAVILPVFYFYYSLLSAGEKADYSRLQKQMKLLMVTGLLSVVLI
jgi:hypothetical protein